MNISVKQVSSLEKVTLSSYENAKPIKSKTLMKGETYSYQVSVKCSDNIMFNVDVESELKDHIKVYLVKDAIMDLCTYTDYVEDDDYITKETGTMPDILMPIEKVNNYFKTSYSVDTLWIKTDIPIDIKEGNYPIKITLTSDMRPEQIVLTSQMILEVTDKKISEQQITFTQWFHTDCIANYHNVKVYSEEHWDLIDKYVHMASELGINMILTPIITPPLDTGIGLRRTNVQLVDIKKDGQNYTFDFSKVKRWIEICNKNNIKYFEISHFFSQWGLKSAPNILVEENGKSDYLFGWHVESTDPEYKNFLDQFLPELVKFLKDEGVADRCYFHISDEPKPEHIEKYKYAYNLIKSHIEGFKTIDALSTYSFYEEGYVDIPVCSTNKIDRFLEHNLPNQWTYYCCSQHTKVANRFLSMPSYRNRIIGLQLYKYDIKGFLHWGYNFYNSQYSICPINPYITTSANGGFPSGDSFSVYPVNNDVIPSLRAVIFKEALQDIEICRTLEKYIGRDNVIKIIDDAAGFSITFDNYPKNADYIINLIDKMENMIKEYSDKE